MKNFPIRFITSASLFDGHDASINIMRRILQSQGAEVIHLGHNRSVQEIVAAAIQEDAQGIAISSYQGGHVEYFKYTVDLLKQAGAGHIKVFGGGGGTITPTEIELLEKYGVEKIYSPQDGLAMGLEGMIGDMVKKASFLPPSDFDEKKITSSEHHYLHLSRALTAIENGKPVPLVPSKKQPKVVGLTGTGGAGKSSFTDEILLRLLEWNESIKVAVLAIDPTRKKTGGALLGDRLRVNALKNPRCFMRSYATRESNASISQATRQAVECLKAADFDWIFVETGGIGQADTSIVDLVDYCVYLMTSEYGAPTQLEKINMLDYADLVVLNKFDKMGALDALTDIRKQFRRNHREFETLPPETYPIFPTIAARFGDPGVTQAFRHLITLQKEKKRIPVQEKITIPKSYSFSLVPADKTRYLAEIVRTVRNYKKSVEANVQIIKELEAIETIENKIPQMKEGLLKEKEKIAAQLDDAFGKELRAFEKRKEEYEKDSLQFQIREKTNEIPIVIESLSHQKIRKISLPRYRSKADLARFVGLENLPGYFPFTGGVFPLKRTEEDPKRMFAGEGTPERTNKRFHLLCAGEKAKRLSTAFDSVTLYGNDPDERPDIYGKIGESGVSVCTLEDAKRLYTGFDLCDPNTSVSMTINGPAPMLLAFYFNTAIDQQVEKFEKENKRKPSDEEFQKIKADTLRKVRGTVQADILKEDQAQNTCIFSTEFALKLMGDIQEYFIKNDIRNYYSVSISGYHIAEAGANPISQLAFTLANGFTYAEYYLSRGMKIDDFAANFSFFFSNGLDPEYTVIGRVARRIWAIALRKLYGANERSQKLKYHIQTSGRSLHAQEISFNDIRTTLQALLAYFDHCNSLHTNAYDEAVTTPTEESVRRAMAIQLILAKEFGWAKNENPLQGSFFIEELTELVEEAVLNEFENINLRGGVLGAMEAHYQRSKIQEESLHYEKLKHTGELPIVGVNSFLSDKPEVALDDKNLTRATNNEKQTQIKNLRAFQKTNELKAKESLKELKRAAIEGKNVFETLMTVARHCSLGQITNALYDVGGEYRRSM